MSKILTVPFEPHEFPGLRIETAIANKVDKELCFVVGGGIGDRVCAEPTLRFALKHFRKWDVSVSLTCETPELFTHLDFKEVFDFKNKYPIIGRHLYLNTYPTASMLWNQFVNANAMNTVDYCSISSLRMQLPEEYKEFRFFFPAPKSREIINCANEGRVLIHPGKGWPTKTFPKEFWHDVIWKTHKRGFRPILIGNNTVDGVEDLFNVCTDLRNRTSLIELAWLCSNCQAIITNDSGPLHLAATGLGKIAFISTCKRGDTLLHFREGELGYNMMDFSKKQMWEMWNPIPNTIGGEKLSELPAGVKIEEFLPDPNEMLDWICT